MGIDLNNDGVIDFTLVESFEAYSHTYTLKALGAQPSSLIATKEMEAGALKRGNSIGNHATHFRTSGFMCTTGKGSFLNTKERFLGVQFLINGEVHYGWIGFRSVTKDLTATLGGWAYETEPNTPIIAGDKGDGGFRFLRSPSGTHFPGTACNGSHHHSRSATADRSPSRKLRPLPLDGSSAGNQVVPATLHREPVVTPRAPFPAACPST